MAFRLLGDDWRSGVAGANRACGKHIAWRLSNCRILQHSLQNIRLNHAQFGLLGQLLRRLLVRHCDSQCQWLLQQQLSCKQPNPAGYIGDNKKSKS